MRWTVLALAATTIGLLGSDCFKPFAAGGDGGIIVDPDSRCAALTGTFPPSLAFMPGGSRIWVVDRAESTLVPFDVDEVPPMQPPFAPDSFTLPADSDSNSSDDVPLPILGEIQIFGSNELIPELPLPVALVTAVNYDEILLFDPNHGDLRAQVLVQVPGPGKGFVKSDNPELPDPGQTPGPTLLRTGLSNKTCVRPGAGALDSFGEKFVVDSPCDESESNSYYATGTSGAAVAAYKTALPGDARRLFVSMTNPGTVGVGSEDPQYLPGTVLVYDINDISGLPIVTLEDRDNFVLFTKGYNPTHVTPYSVGERSFVLVTVSGAVGIVENDDAIPDVEEVGFVAQTDAAIEVFDAETLAQVAIIPLGQAGLTGGLAIDPSGRIAVAGSLVGRWLLAVDLAPLATLDLERDDLPATLDGTLGNPNAVLYNADDPFLIPERSPTPAGSSCPGISAGVAFNHAGDLVYATGFCDGTLAAIGVSLAEPPGFNDVDLINLTATFDTTDPEAPRGPGPIAVRPGAPGSTPDVFVLISGPDEGLLCAIDYESTPPSP